MYICSIKVKKGMEKYYIECGLTLEGKLLKAGFHQLCYPRIKNDSFQWIDDCHYKKIIYDSEDDELCESSKVYTRFIIDDIEKYQEVIKKYEAELLPSEDEISDAFSCAKWVEAKLWVDGCGGVTELTDKILLICKECYDIMKVYNGYNNEYVRYNFNVLEAIMKECCLLKLRKEK